MVVLENNYLCKTMISKDNDINLLKSNPNSLMIKYKPVIESLVVKKLIKPGYFQFQEKDDIVQEVATGLFHDIEKIRKSFNGYSKFRPFFVRIIINRCEGLRRDVYKQETKKIINDNPDNPTFEKKIVYSKKYSYTGLNINNHYSNIDTDKEAILGSELEYLDAIFRMYSLQKPKLLICLKLFSGYPITYKDLKFYKNNCEQDIYKRVIEFAENNTDNTKDINYQVLTDFFNCCDKTEKKKDALRKWLTNILSAIIRLLNKDSLSPVYNKQTIMGLISLYFNKKDSPNS